MVLSPDLLSSDASSPWTPIKALSALVESAILKKQPGVKHDLEIALRKHKPQFIALLKNPARSPTDADLVRKAQSEGIRLPGAGDGLQKLPAQVVEEALILSELFNLNEISALQLLLKGEEQLCDYPGLTRGLVAVLLYYDARKSLVQSLRTLIQGREGLTWTLELGDDITELVSVFTGQLIEEGLVDKILNLLKTLDWTKERTVLQKNMALGDAKHRRQVSDLFEDIRQSLADCIFSYAAQTGLNKNDTLRLMDHLSRVKPGDVNAMGVIDDTNLTLVMALMYAMDVSALSKCEDDESGQVNLPLLKDAAFIPALHRELGPSGTRKFDHPAIQALVQFTWAMSIATLRSVPQNEIAQEVVDDDETVADIALEGRLFHLLPHVILENPAASREEFYMRRFHQLVTDFIVLMPLKVKELRNRADDAARNNMMHEQEGIVYNIPLVGQHFEYFMRCLAKLYEKDNLGLVLDFWCPTDGAITGSGQMERLPHRQVSLYKFVRLAGDLLMPTLYSPYVDMLVSLSGHAQSALHCFNLLKLNGLGGQGANTVSWDHFFNSMQQYFSNLRQELPHHQQANMDPVYRLARPMTRGISPAEINGLMTVLKLIQAVCNHCDAARVALSENSSWQPLLVIIGLLGCAIPTPLKAELLRTLASLAKSPDVAYVAWQNVETAQLINTIPTANNLQRQGMSTELEEVETRMEEYPMTKSFLHLIDVLTDGLIPNALGAGTRTPGFEPYLNFIRDSIFLRFNTRAYKNVAEKWEISTGCLRIIQKLLVDYSPLATDFNRPGHQQDLTSPVGRHPGFYIMIHLLQSSEMLRMIMFILDEGCSHIDTYLKFPGKASLEEACLLSLQILDSALSKQASFMEAARAANTSTLLTSLDQLLLGVNPRSGRADHMLNITKFVTYSWWLPRHTLHAVRVLSAVADSPSAQAGILATLNTTDQIGLQIIKGFTDVLDNEEEENLEEEVASSGRCIGAARIAIVQMLLNGLEKPAPSLSHFLLGFDLKKGVSRSTLQPPGVFGSIRTPLHAILAFLRPIGPKQPSPTLSHAPHLCESAFMLIYHLAANQQTSEPSLRYLRSTEDFLSTHLALLPLDDGGPMSVQITKGISWLLKTLAIELKLVSSARLRSQVALLIGLLLDADTASNMNNTTIADELSTTFGGETAMSQLSRSVTTTTRVGTDQFSQGQHRLILILNSIDFAEETISTPTWDVFDTNQIGQLLKSCEQSKAPGEKSIDIQKLHKILNEELANLQGAAALSQRQIIQEEIKSVLLYAVRWNSLQDQTLAKRSILDSWRQVTEVMLCSVPGDVLSASAKQQLLLDLLQTLLNKVLADNTMPELTNQVSGVVLLLIAALRQTYLSKEGSGSSGSGGSRENYVSILDAVRDRDPNRASSAPLYSTALHVILKGLVMWITSTSASAQRVRSNLYGALVNFLRIGKSSNTEDRTPSIYRSASLDLTEQAKFRKTNLEVISTYGDNFLDILCRDTVSGHDIRRMLALSVLDELVHLDGRGSWTFYMSNQGYLRHIIESMTIEDQHLVQLLSAEPDNLKALYTYESKMAMLTRLASTVTGAELLLESGLMVRLSDMTIFSSRPDIGPNPALSVAAMDVDDQTFIPSPLQRYYQILFPALRLCQALLASLGSGNRSVTAQVLHFITSNEELVRTVLKTRGIFSLSHLQELALLTGVIARCVSFETFEGAASAADLELSGYVSRIQRQMLALIPHFDLNDDVSELIKNTIPERSQADALRFVLETNANVMMFARNIAAKNSSNAKFQRVIFTPSLIEAKERGDYDDRFSSVSVAIPNRPPSLGHVVRQVQHLSRHLIESHSKLSELTDKLNSIEQLSSNELTSFLPSGTGDKVSSSDKRKIAAETMSQMIVRKEHEIRLSGSAIESAAFLVWKHLEYFLLYANSSGTSTLTPYQRAHLRKDDTLMGDEFDSISGQNSLSLEAVETLKAETVSCFNDALFIKLQDVEQIYGKKKNFADAAGILEVLIRRLKRLTTLQT